MKPQNMHAGASGSGSRGWSTSSPAGRDGLQQRLERAREVGISAGPLLWPLAMVVVYAVPLALWWFRG